MTTAVTTFLPEEIEALFQQLSETQDTWAGGAALYGPGGLWDATRKARLALTAADIRDSYNGEKITESKIDEMAHAHPDYNAWLDRCTIERAKWLTLDAERTAIMLKLKVLTYNPVR